MEMIFNGMILKGKFLLVTGNRTLKSSNKGIYIFADKSEVDLNTGVIVKDTKSGTPHALMLQVLGPGTQTISTGVKNEDPKILSWSALALDIDYSGDIIVSPTSDTQITVVENEFCFTSIEDDTVFITPANYTTVTVDTSINMISNISGGTRPPLRISAPVDVNITSRSGKLIFTQVKDVTLVNGDLDGNTATNIFGNLTKRSTINIRHTNSVTVSTQSSLTLNIDTADTVKIDSHSRIDLSVKNKIRSLHINNSSATNIVGGSYNDLNIENSGGRLDLVNFESINKLTITTGSAVKISGENCNSINIKKAERNRVDITVKSCDTLLCENPGSVTINGISINSICVNDATSRVEIETKQSDTVTIRCQNAASIKGDRIGSIDITNRSRVDVAAKKLDNISVTSTSAVVVECEEGEQNASIETKSRVELRLAIAKSVKVETSSFVSVSAYKYLTDPIIETTSRKTVEIRK